MTNVNCKMAGGSKAASAKNVNGGDNNDKNVVAVMVFENPEFGKIRTAKSQEGEPLFCGKDVCDALGYTRADNAVRQHVSNVDASKQCINVPGCIRKDGSRTSRRTKMLFVNESGFYALVLGSKLPNAQRFKQWVTSVVLPQIRKTGGYIPVGEGDTDDDVRRRAEEILGDTLRQKDALIEQQKKLLGVQGVRIEQQKKLLGEQVARIEQLNKQVDEQLLRIQKSADEILDLEHDVDRLLPKALYSDNVLDSISCFTTTQVAKELGITAQELNRSLCAAHIQYYQSGQYMLYADYAHMGLAKSRTKVKNVMCEVTEDGFKCGRTYTHTYLVWTERGRKFIHQLAKRYWELAKVYSEK